MPYTPGNPAGDLAGGLLAGSSLALQYRQVRNQEEQQKRANELANFQKALEFSKIAKGTAAQSVADEALTKAGVQAGIFPEGVSFNSSTPEAKDFLQTLQTGMKAVKEGIINEDQFHRMVNKSYSQGIASKDPLAEKVNYEAEMKKADTGIANSLLRGDPNNPQSLSTSQGPLLQLPNVDPAYNTPEAKQGILAYSTPTVDRAAQLSPDAVKEYQAEIDRGKPKEPKEEATDHYTIKNTKTGEMRSMRLKSGESIPYGWETVTPGMTRDTKQQTSFVDENGTPFIYDPKTETYKKATVEGGAALQPKKKSLPAETTDSMSKGITYLGQVDKVNNLFDKALTGPAQGNVNKAVGILANNPEFQKLRFDIGTLRTVVYQLSGKQINEQEQAWLEKEILPSLIHPDKNFKAKLGELESWMSDVGKNQVETFRTSYIIPKNVDEFYKKRAGKKPIAPSSKTMTFNPATGRIE